MLALVMGLASASAEAEPTAPSSSLRVRWTSVAGLILEDGTSTLIFDPIFTRPGIWQWLGLKRLLPDTQVVHENLEALHLKKADAVFVSHEHFDHAVDAPLVSRILDARLYGGESLERIEKASQREFGWKLSLFQTVKDRETITVGKFKVQIFKRTHSAIFPKLNFHFLAGVVPVDFNFEFDQYREGDVYGYVIEHPDGKILVDQGSHFFEGAREALKGVDYMLVGVSNKVSVADFIEKHVDGFHPKILIPLHFDFFFTQPNRKNTFYLPGTDLNEIREKIGSDHGLTRFIEPKWGVPIELKPVPLTAGEPTPTSTPTASPTPNRDPDPTSSTESTSLATPSVIPDTPEAAAAASATE